MKADLATDVRAAAAAGFDYVEIWAAKLRDFLKTHSVKDLKTLFNEGGVKPLSINSIEHITFREMRQLRAAISLGSNLRMDRAHFVHMRQLARDIATATH